MNPLILQLATEIEKTLEESGQLNLMSDLAEELFARSQKALKSRVISATLLSDDQQNKIKDKLNNHEIEFVIDEAILGGLVVESGGKLQDFSLRNKLNTVKMSISK